MSRVLACCFAAALVACGAGGRPTEFTCVDNSQCDLNGVDGKCIKSAGADAGITGYCAFPSTDCPSGYAYDTTAPAELRGTCTFKPKSLGENCGANNECESSYCIDGVCCNSACTDRCRSCAVPGKVGICEFVAAGSQDPRGSCTNDGTVCGTDGTCDGSGSCAKAPTTKQCSSGSCMNGVFTSNAFCDGNGSCGRPMSTICDPYVCKADGTGCETTCSGAGTECKPPNSCMSGSCGKRANGASCSDGTQCQSNSCVDGVCCQQSSCPTCMRCNVNGVGTCASVPQGGTDTRCNGQPASTCGRDGKCDGANNCTNWPAGTQCVPPTCDASALPVKAINGAYSMANPYGTCPGNGAACPAPSVVSCSRNMGCHISAGRAECWFSCGVCNPSNGQTAFVDNSRCAPGTTCKVCYGTSATTGDMGCAP
jgi:hypothetical protein